MVIHSQYLQKIALLISGQNVKKLKIPFFNGGILNPPPKHYFILMRIFEYNKM